MAKVSFILGLILAVASLCLADDCEDSCPDRVKAEIYALKQQADGWKQQAELLMATAQRLEEFCNNGTDTTRYQNCAEIQNVGYTEDGVYTIYLRPRAEGVSVYCDLTTDGGGWTVFQKRKDGSIDFYRDFVPYKRGFGRPKREYWLGLNNMRLLVQQGSQELRVDLEDWAGATAFAKYSEFSISPANDGYKLHVGVYSGNAGDGMSRGEGSPFSTKDNDNDRYSDNCAVLYKGAWWYEACHESNLNGHYFQGGAHASYADGLEWRYWKGYNYSMKKTQMKMRPAGFTPN